MVLSNDIKRLKRTRTYRTARRRLKKTILYENLQTAYYYWMTMYKGFKHGPIFKDVKTCCLFIGHGRSGHSIIGALLDANPNAIVSDEIDIVKYLAAGFSQEQLYHLMLMGSQKLAERKRIKHGREEKYYSYWVPGQWQGRFENLEVIGDSKAAVSARRLANNPALIEKLQQGVHAEIKFIQIVRNPYDNISTLAIQGDLSLEEAIKHYFSFCEDVINIRPRIDDVDIFIGRHEDLIENSEGFLRKINRYIGLEPTKEYLDACASIIFKSPSKTRYIKDWNSELIEIVRRKMGDYDFLHGYSYEN